ncbi:hypothetical protein, partial [Paracoccus thiocyanatus]|uniref:hypothetical protein n=1 Tax=Paracoccus thiocyanatus TaxID=34006 RepID=UPI001C6E8DFB
DAALHHHGADFGRAQHLMRGQVGQQRRQPPRRRLASAEIQSRRRAVSGGDGWDIPGLDKLAGLSSFLYN